MSGTRAPSGPSLALESRIASCGLDRGRSLTARAADGGGLREWTCRTRRNSALEIVPVLPNDRSSRETSLEGRSPSRKFPARLLPVLGLDSNSTEVSIVVADLRAQLSPCPCFACLPDPQSRARTHGPYGSRSPEALLAAIRSPQDRFNLVASRWAQSDLNRRPPGYQPGAPAKLSYGPVVLRRLSITYRRLSTFDVHGSRGPRTPREQVRRPPSIELP